MSVLARVPMERVREESLRVGDSAAHVQWGRLALTVIVGIFYGLGWGARTIIRWVLTALTVVLYAAGRAAGWSWAAIRVGWQDAQAAQARR